MQLCGGRTQKHQLHQQEGEGVECIPLNCAQTPRQRHCYKIQSEIICTVRVYHLIVRKKNNNNTCDLENKYEL